MEDDNKDFNTLMEKPEFNKLALAATIRGISNFQLVLDKFKQVQCPSGEKVLILKDPLKAFEIYGEEYTKKVNVLTDVLNKLKVGGDVEVSKKTDIIFKNLDNISYMLNEMYKNSYLTYISNPCDEKFQEYKLRADNIIMAAIFYLGNIQLLLSSLIGKDPEEIKDGLDKVIEYMHEMSEKIINKILEN
jgi:hypothetical protein